MNIFNVNSLTSIQLQRYYSLISTYGEQTPTIVLGLKNRGKNSYAAFIDKMDTVLKAKHDEQDYYEALYEKFELNKFYSCGEVISGVVEVRREMELEPYKSKLKMRCEADFFLLFVFEEIFDTNRDSHGVETKTLIGYKPLAKVRPDISDANA